MSAVLSLALFQAPVDATGAAMHLIVIELGIIALFFLLLMIGALVALMAMMKVVKRVEAKGNELEARGQALIAQVTGKVYPIIDKTNEIVADLTPRIKAVGENVEQISYTARAKADEIADTVTELKKTVLQMNETVQQFNATAQDANLRARGQVARVDAMVTDAMNTTHEVSVSIQEGIKRPVRKVAEMIHGMKAAVEGYAAKVPFFHRQPKGPGSPYDF